ncbi:MAG: DUF448 domain-containing protein [Thermodesulfobacteriota bacterium]|jgi:predicted RNA-binding protein YlxR (DUF448 family)
MSKGRATPVRFCVGCGTRDAKDQMFRFAIGEGGRIVFGAGNGRGGYLHPRRQCVQSFSARSGFVRSVGVALSKAMRQACVAFIEQNGELRP